MVENQKEHGERNAADKAQSLLVQTFVHHLEQQQSICDVLEAIADSLPGNVDVQVCHRVGQTLLPLIVRAHQFEESQLFPFLGKSKHFQFELMQTIKRLRAEHVSDEDYAADICGAFAGEIRNLDRSQAESLGWMLRGFFENVRRHISLEREHILPLIETNYTKLTMQR